MRPYILAETNWKSAKETAYEVAILPWGATEAHNYHLPYATDNYQVEHVMQGAAKQAWEAGAKVVVLPCIPFGVNTGQMDVNLCMNLNPSTQFAILMDVAEVLQAHGIRKLVIANGHGGNHFKQMLRELALAFPELFACAANWFDAANWDDFFDEPGNHAGEMETSAMMHIAPELVLPLEEAGDGYERPWVIRALREGWVSAQRQWTKGSADTVIGNPALATAEKGAAYTDA